ncbi:MAG: hypothetical protein FWD69_03835 [Polyangiaceae bacterium]|nr:hypothetical protein [Polyangiaceae bacterium]
MSRKIAFVVAAACLFALAPITGRFGLIVASVSLVWLSVLVAVAASGSVSALAVASGAAGALAGGLLASLLPAAAGAALVACAFVERTTRIRTPAMRALHVLFACAAGALAGFLSAAFASSSFAITAVAVVVAAVVCALPLLVPADDPVAHALDLASRSLSGSAREYLANGAKLRRFASDVTLDRNIDTSVTATWRSLLRLAEARVRLEHTLGQLPSGEMDVLGMVDQRIEEHVRALMRAYAAVDTASAASVALDDVAKKDVEATADSLEEVGRALVEVRDACTTPALRGTLPRVPSRIGP